MRMTSACIPTGSGIPRLPTRPRTIVRAVHVLASVGWLGLVVVMPVLSGAGRRHVAAAAYRLTGAVNPGGIPVSVLVGGADGRADRPWWTEVHKHP